MAGTDNTAAINSALASGKQLQLPPGYFYYAGPLYTAADGSGINGSGSASSFLITDRNFDRHISVAAGTRDTSWTGFAMIGPFSENNKRRNRALTVGTRFSGTGTASAAWDASGTWIDDFTTYGYSVGVHIAAADHVRFGTIKVFEAGNSREEPGSYGITCSGSDLQGKYLHAENTSTRGRHALYYTGIANDCYVEKVEAKGFDLAAVQNRARIGGGQRNGFGWGFFDDCNTNDGIEPVGSIRGVVNFVCADGIVVPGAGKASIGDYVAVNCGGFPGPSLRYMPQSQCGTVRIFGHAGSAHFTRGKHYGSEIYYSNDVRLPELIFVNGYGPSGLNDPSFRPIVVEGSSGCYGGSVQMHPGAIYTTD
ncbi:hypothetical protein [Mycobacterium sp. MS1601]|uniref:hypothetical protein n=1 Tax=Mycobacterium sp. MS1601 TaxID=1936029 RepID=UPI0012F86526|nr:hypothetical protein [Mycobacterium sp. MS1601]